MKKVFLVSLMMVFGVGAYARKSSRKPAAVTCVEMNEEMKLNLGQGSLALDTQIKTIYDTYSIATDNDIAKNYRTFLADPKNEGLKLKEDPNQTQLIKIQDEVNADSKGNVSSSKTYMLLPAFSYSFKRTTVKMHRPFYMTVVADSMPTKTEDLTEYSIRFVEMCQIN